MAILDETMFGPVMGGGGLLGLPPMLPQQQQQQSGPFGISPDMLLALGAGIAGGRDWGSGIGAGLQGALGAKQNAAQMDLRRQQYAQGGFGPASVQEYNFARQNGFKGSFEDWINNKSRGDQRYGLQPVYARDAQGNLRAFQLDSSGGMKPVDFGEGYSPAPPVTNVDVGTGFQPLNSRTGQPAAPVIPKDVSGAAAAQEAGKVAGGTQAQATVDLPTVERKADIALKTIEQIRKHPGNYAGAALARHVPYTDARAFGNLVDQAKSQLFLEAYTSLRGGGNIATAEGEKAEKAMGRLDIATKPGDFNAALADIEEVIQGGVNTARRKAGLPPLPFQPRGQTTTPAPMASPAAAKMQDRVPAWNDPLGIR